MEGFSIVNIVNSAAHFMQTGGFFSWVVVCVWGTAIAICIDKYKKLKRFDVDAPSFMNEVQRYILSNDIQGAIRTCSGSAAVLPKVLKSGLKRANQNSDQIQNAIDATTLEVIPKVESRLNYLALIANLSMLLGLLGTIHGLILAFASVAGADPAQKQALLAKGISETMNTTALGLGSAITVMVAHTYLSSKAEKIIGEIDEYAVKLLDLLGTKNRKADIEE